MGGLTVEMIRKAQEALKAAPKPDWLVTIDGKEYVMLNMAKPKPKPRPKPRPGY